MNTPSGKSDFMAAEEIKAILAGRDRAEQERIMRWVGESLGVVAVPVQPPAYEKAPVPVAAHGNIASDIPLGARKADIKTFVTTKKPKSDMQLAAVCAYFYRFEATESERKDTVTPDDLQTASRQARGFSFKDARVTLNNAVRQGYFDRSGERGVFSLNAVGENLVAMALPSSGSDNGGMSKPKRKGTNAKPARAAKKGR